MLEQPTIDDPTRTTRPTGSRPIARVLGLLVCVAAVQSVLTWVALDALVGAEVPTHWLVSMIVVSTTGVCLAIAVGRFARSGPVPTSLTIAIAALIGISWTPASMLATRVARSRAEAALSGWAASAETTEIERLHGYSSGATQWYPQVSRPPGHGEGPWVARETDRAADATPLAPDARGGLVLVSDEASLSLDSAHVFLGARAARNAEEVSWVGLVSRVWPVAYHYDGGLEVTAERVDVRVVDLLTRAVIARVSIGAVPPARWSQRSGTEREEHAAYDIEDELVAHAVRDALDDDGRASPIADPAWDAEGCEVPASLTSEIGTEPEACIEGVTSACDRACREGSRDACRIAGYVLDHASPARARPYYALACRAGDANACTNFAAGLLRELDHETSALEGARRVFESTCAVGEAWGCGMLGGMLAHGEGGEEDDARARALLDASCADDNGFSCEVLGGALERGELGDAGATDPVDAAARLRRACELGRGPHVCARADELTRSNEVGDASR